MPPGAVAPVVNRQQRPASARQAPQANGQVSTAENEEQKTQRLLQQADEIEQRRQVLRLATMEPHREPACSLTHWDYVMKEMRWMAVDFTEERHWKRAVARAVAHEIAAVSRSSMLRHTSLLDEELQSCQEKEAEVAKMLKARMNSGKSASTSAPQSESVITDTIFADLDTEGSLAPGTPLNEEGFLFSYPANDKVSDFLSDYLHKIAEAEVISHELDIREYELDYEAAKKTAAAVAIEAEKEEERRIKALEKNPLGDLAEPDEDDFNFDKKPRRVKKPHHLDEFESGFDDEMETPGLPRRSTIDRKRRLPPVLEARDSKQARRETVDANLATRKSTYKYDSNGKRVSKPARISVPGTRFDGSQVRHPGTATNAVPWSSMEEQLLCAVVHEFGPNFAFAADVLAACSQLQGIFRRASQCKEKFKQLTAPTDGQVSQETALAQQITKGQAREIMQKYMPVPEAALQTHCSALVTIAVKHKQLHIQERAREQDKLQQSQPPHPSQAVVQQAVHSKTANRHLNAMEMIEWANTKHKQQQRIELQQQQAIEQQQRQQAQQGMGPGGMHQPQPAAAPAAATTVAAAAVQQGGFQGGQPMGPQAHASPMMPGTTTADLALGPPQGAGGVRPPMGMMAPGSGSPAMNPAMQNFAGANPHAAVPPSSQQQQQQLVTKMQQCMQNVQKLQNMLTQGKNSAGQPITEEQRNQYSNNLGAVSRHYKQLQMQYNLLRSGVPPHEVQHRVQQMQLQQQRQQQQQQQQGMQAPQQVMAQHQQQPGMQAMTQSQAPQQVMRPPGYAYSGAMPGQPRPHMGMQQGNMGMPQGPMSPIMSGVGNMQAPQMNGMGMGMPQNPMMNQPGMHPHAMGQQPPAPGMAHMMPPQAASQAMQGVQQMRPPVPMQQPPQQLQK